MMGMLLVRPRASCTRLDLVEGQQAREDASSIHWARISAPHSRPAGAALMDERKSLLNDRMTG